MMFTQVWNKYLPIIRILFKRSRMEDQVLEMNESDFMKAAGGKKCSYKFNINLVNGRADNVLSSPVAKDLSAVLLSDDAILALVKEQGYELHMNKKFQLAIHMIPAPEQDREEQDDADLSEEAAVETYSTDRSDALTAQPAE